MDESTMAGDQAAEEQIVRRLQVLAAALEAAESGPLCGHVTALRPWLEKAAAAGVRAREAFRLHQGFEIVCTSLRSHLEAQRQPKPTNDLELLQSLSCHLLVLSAAVACTARNEEYFSIKAGGWAALEGFLKSMFSPLGSNGDLGGDINLLSRVLGVLLAVAFGIESFGDLSRNTELNGTSAISEAPPSEVFDMQNALGANFDLNATLCNPSLVVIMLKLCMALGQAPPKVHGVGVVDHPSSNGDSQVKKVVAASRLFQQVYATVSHLASFSDDHCIALHRVGTLTLVLQFLVQHPPPGPEMRELVRLSQRLLSCGLTNLEDAQCLIMAPESLQPADCLLLHAVRSTRDPPHFTFDLSLAGYASLELQELGSPFPHPEPAKGYSVMMWLRVERYDDSCHTTLFGAFDRSQTCFVLIYLERKHRQLVLQTSLSSKDPSVRFKSVNFQEHRLYHVTIVHQKSRTGGPSRALLFLDGVFQEQVRCAFPNKPPKLPSTAGKAQKVPSAPVQAFFGTPYDLSPKLGAGLLYSKWSLATGYLFNEALPEEIIMVYQKLGPSYRGNFQDCLGSFQTYDASAVLNLYHESLPQDGRGQSIISAAIHSRGSKINPESTILLSLSASMSSSSPALRTGLAAHQMEARLSPRVANAAVPSLLKSPVRRNGLASVMGGIVQHRPLSMQEALWRLSGCVPMVLQRVALACTAESLLRATEFFFESFKDSWRNSEAMERGHGYGILALLLRNKLLGESSFESGPRPIIAPLPAEHRLDGKLALRLLELILRSTTRDFDTNDSALITNPLAFRMLVIDNDMWHHASPGTQHLFYERISNFTSKSRHSIFNVKRLIRMRVIKRFIEIIKSGCITEMACASMTSAFSNLVEKSMDAETLRSVALYITYAFQTNGRVSATTTAISAKKPHTRSFLANFEVGIRVLVMLTDLICHKLGRDAIFKISRSVTTKWLLYLLSVEDARVVAPAFRLLMHMLISGGESFRAKFEARQGYTLLRLSIRKWFALEDVWLMTFALMFAADLSNTNSRRLQDLSQWLTGISASDELDVSCPAAWTLLQDLLEESLRSACVHGEWYQREEEAFAGLNHTTAHEDATKSQKAIDRDLLLFVLSLTSAIYSQVAAFRQCITSETLARTFLSVLFFAIDHCDSTDTVNDDDASRTRTDHRLVEDESGAEIPISTKRIARLLQDPENEFLRPLAPVKPFDPGDIASDVCFCDVTRLLVTVLTDQILDRKDFSGLGLFLKSPPASDGKRSWLNSLVLSRVLSTLTDRVTNDISPFQSPKTITNIVRLISQCYEANIEGWFVNGGHELLSFTTTFLDRVQDPAISNLKSVRLCTPFIEAAHSTLINLVIYQLVLFQHRSEKPNQWLLLLKSYRSPNSNDLGMFKDFLVAVQRAMRFVKIADNDEGSETQALSDPRLLPSLICQLYWHTRQSAHDLRSIALGALRTLVANHRAMAMSILKISNTLTGFNNIEELLDVITGEDEGPFLSFSEIRGSDIDTLMHGSLETSLYSLIRMSNSVVMQKAMARSSKRRDRLHECHLRDLAQKHSWTEHEVSMRIWNENIFNSEELKSLRASQDRQENYGFLQGQLILMQEQQAAPKFPVRVRPQRVDEGEGRDRMRLRLSPSRNATDTIYRPKRSKRSDETPNRIKDDRKSGAGRPRIESTSLTVERQAGLTTSSTDLQHLSTLSSTLPDDDFEMVYSPDDGAQDVEDKNRKVMRSLQRGEQVINVYNVSRIRGLEALESLLIIGRKALYIIDGLFQRSDGEVVHTSQAPIEERDSFVQLIAGREIDREAGRSSDINSSTKHWPWGGIVSISKRTFLLRPVAVEIFFEDGRSYLLVAVSEGGRDSLYVSLVERSLRLQETTARSGDPSAWRVDLLPKPREAPSTVAGRFANAFSLTSSIPATQRWVKGEISNFQYLMMINTMAGRTFNDLTQYPIFPWILADYASPELDLTNPKSFRDLSKPMGCQNPQREASFRERYNTFADMNETQTPAFHYGTHYSSAMIVTSFLIRLKPYVDAYLLLQGGSFDHADRLFYSIERTWASASRTNMSDVRELTPEFFYLPEFLINCNGYDFGSREGDGERIDHVQLPPWAKGDPKIFIWKHREALESPYVSQNLQAWIDLVFGFKQRGEAAIEATNVFHHLSYQGSRNIERIDDPMERLATIGIIHNFGQTPQHLFAKAHPRRIITGPKAKSLQTAIDTLIRLPSPKYEYSHPIVELEYVQSHQRLLFCGPGRTFLSGLNVVLEWANAEGSVRFFAMDSGQLLGLFEGLHQADITVSRFANSTLVTASTDCTIGLWNVTKNPDMVDLQLNEFLFGHRSPVSVVVVSDVLSVILSADNSGRTILWDLNTHEAIREFELDESINCASINNSNGHLLLASSQRILLYTINGERILEHPILSNSDELVACCAFYESNGNDWMDTELVFTGHRKGVVNVWRVTFGPDGRWFLELMRRLDHVSTQKDRSNYPSTITAVHPTDHCVYTGDEDGRVFEWSIVR